MKTIADYPDLFAQLHSYSGSSLQPTAISFGTSMKLLWNKFWVSFSNFAELLTTCENAFAVLTDRS